MIRILIVDDSPTQRMLIHAILASDPELQVIAEARNGETAIELCKRYQPDIVTMDINMPGMGGYEAIRHIMSESPRPIVVLTSIDSQYLLDVSFKALELGALTVLSKPLGMSLQSPEAQNLIMQIKSMSTVKVVRKSMHLQSAIGAENIAYNLRGKKESPPPQHGAYKVVAVGVSTGGPPTLQKLLNGLPSSFPIPIIVVQHISQGFVSGLASWLHSTTPFHCKVVEQGEKFRPGRVYLAPDNQHLTINPSGSAWLEASEPVANLRPSVNVLFEAVANRYGTTGIGILLTGMGDDGAKGLLSMYRTGAYTIAQDECSSVVFGMPKAAIELGAAREVLALDQIATRLLDLVLCQT